MVDKVEVDPVALKAAADLIATMGPMRSVGTSPRPSPPSSVHTSAFAPGAYLVTTVPSPWTSSSNRTILVRACNPAGTPSSRRW
jgi:hypothetical protein